MVYGIGGTVELKSGNLFSNGCRYGIVRFFAGKAAYIHNVGHVEMKHLKWTQEMKTEAVKSDGWETSYYDIPDTVKDIDDLIVYFGLNWHMANILKAAVRYGKKEGVTKQYDLNKIKFMVEREEKHNTPLT
jgi:hypothetical protein